MNVRACPVFTQNNLCTIPEKTFSRWIREDWPRHGLAFRELPFTQSACYISVYHQESPLCDRFFVSEFSGEQSIIVLIIACALTCMHAYNLSVSLLLFCWSLAIENRGTAVAQPASLASTRR